MSTLEDVATGLLDKSRAKGATAGDSVVAEGERLEVLVRLKGVDKLSNAREKRVGLRLFFGRRSAVCSTSDFSPEALDRLVDDTCRLAQTTAEDPFSGLPEPAPLNAPDLDLYDPAIKSFGLEDAIGRARQAETAALDFDPRIKNSEGASLSRGDRRVVYANTHGFVGTYPSGSISLSVSPIAAEGGMMQRDYWYSTKRKLRDLASSEEVGRRAALRTIRRLGARKIKTCQVPVVYDSETASELLGNVSAAVSGYAVYKEASFLAGAVGKTVASSCVTILDDGLIPGGLGSRPFDGEGLSTRKTPVIRKGVLENYLLDSYSGRKLGMASTGNAARSVGDSPSVAPTNFFLVPGTQTPEEIIRSVRSGLYVIELIGFGINLVTGDYSQGAVGLWIENGELSYPVEEITIAGNLKNMLMNIETVGNDLELRGSVASPTLKIGRMMVAGN